MLDNIIAFSIKNKFIIGLLTTGLVIWGIWSAGRLPVDAVPDITNNQVQIITSCPTLAGQEVEQLVTHPIERSLANLPGLTELRSISRFGLSVITAVFEEEVDVYFARQLINERLKEAAAVIPPGIGSPELAPVSTGLGEVFQYIIHPARGSEHKYTAMELRTMQDWIVARQLYGTPGIAEVNSYGGQLKQYEVAVNPDKLLAMNVTLSEIFTALERNNENTGGAYIDKKPNAYFIRSVGLVSNFDDIRNIVVRSNPNGTPILIKDVAEVHFGSAVRYGAMTYNGEKDAVGGVIMMLKGANSAEVVDRVKARLPVIQKSLPEDVVIEPYLDRRTLVDRAISTVKTNLIEGALIVIFVLVIFLGNLRAGLIVASAIPLSMLFALAMMQVFGVSANLMSLGAIDFGLIVDGAVIIVEATMHHLALRKPLTRMTQAEMDEEVFRSASRIRSSAAFGEIIILIVYIPILTLVGIEGKMFRPMAQTVGFAILGALLLSLTYIPMMSALLLSKSPARGPGFSDRLMAFFQRLYAPLLEKAMRQKKAVIGLTSALFLLSVFLFSRMGSEFIPTLQEGDFAFHCILPQGTSLSQSVETSMQAARMIREFDEVRMVVGKTGSAEVPTDPMPPEASDLVIILKPRNEWKRKISYQDLSEEIGRKLEALPGVFIERNQPIQMRFNELMTGIRQDVAVKIFGEDLDSLLAYADQVRTIIRQVEGATEPMTEQVEGLPQVVIRYNRARLANYGLTISDVNHLVSTAFAGGKAGLVFENERRFDLVVRLDSAHRNSIEDVSHLYIPDNNGRQIPLSQVAEIRMEPGPAQISRENGRRRIVTGFNVRGRDVSGVVKDIQERLDREVKLPEGYYFTYGGMFENLQAASKRLMIAVPAALALIFVLLYLTFHSVRQSLLIFTAIPMSAIGGVIALLLRDMPFSIPAGIGFIALFGVAVLNGIVLIGTFNQLEKEGVSDILERIRQGTRDRLRPVLMTATVASLGFLPMALSQGSGAEVQKPLATVVIGGLVSATFLTLFVLPVLYYLFYAGRRIRVSPAALLLATSLLFSQQIKAQPAPRQISLEEALETARKNNLLLRSALLNTESAGYMKRSSFELPKTSVTMQYGQYNSIHQDLGLSISQSIPFPGYYTARTGLYKAQLEGARLREDVSANEIRSQVRSLFYRLYYLLENGRQLTQLDSAYSGFVRASGLRYRTGESSLLEKTSAETRQGQLKLLLLQNENEQRSAYASLAALLNTQEAFGVQPPQVYEPLLVSADMDTALIQNNPSLKLLYQNALIAGKNKKTELNQALPDLSIGYFNQSLAGVQSINGQDVFFDQSKRFTGINAGIAIPLTFFSNTARVKSLAFQQQALLKEAEHEKLQLQARLQNAFRQYHLALAQYNYYRATALPNARTILSSAGIAFHSGDISYIEYLQALQTSTEIELAHLQTIDQVNQAVILIHFLIQQ
jgi:cobalt-zinc-cadmium resistance protein CzcA